MKRLMLTSCFLVFSAVFASANPLYTKCIQCHGANGEKVSLGKSKIIKDMSKEDFINAMKGYQNDTYGGTLKAVMKAQATGLSEADIKSIADFIIK